MARWYVLPPRAPARLYYAREAGEDGSAVTRLVLRLDPSLRQPIEAFSAAGWERVLGLGNVWHAPHSAERSPLRGGVKRFLDGHGARLTDLPAAEQARRYRLAPCPAEAEVIGRNSRGWEVRQHEGLRWMLPPRMDFAQSWAGSEKILPAGSIHLCLRPSGPEHWAELADRLASDAAGGFRLGTGDFERLAARLIEPDPLRGPLSPVEDAAASADLLRQKLILALIEPARGSGRMLWDEARSLLRAFPSLGSGSDSLPPPDVCAALAAAAGPLGAVQLIRPDGKRCGWEYLFGGGNGGAALFDGRGMAPEEAASSLAAIAAGRAGRITALLPASPAHPDIEAARRGIGRIRAVEDALHIPAGVAGDSEFALISIGDPRPERLPEPPPQAMRCAEAEGRGDIRRWLDNALRARGRISGEQDRPARLTPYVPASRIGAARCMIPRGQEAAARTAMARVIEDHGPVDEFVAGRLGVTPDRLEELFSPEQVDAIAAAEAAHARGGRAFLLADQTGTGKGRAAVGAARAWLAGGADRSVIYLTVSQDVALDVLRDLRDTDSLAATGRPFLIGNEMAADPEEAVTVADLAARRRIFESGALPEGCRFAVMTYSSFSQAAYDDYDKTDRQRLTGRWLTQVSGGGVMLVLDESHTALNPKGATGGNVSAAVTAAARTLFVSATAARNGATMEFYEKLLPAEMRGTQRRELLRGLRSGDAAAQESFVTALVEDGVMLRRDHDAGGVSRILGAPSAAENARNGEVMAHLRRIAGLMVAAKREMNDHVLAPRRMELRRGQARVGRLEDVYSTGFGAPLEQMASLILNALKTDQTVRLAAGECRGGRKPLISITGTNAGFLKTMLDGAADFQLRGDLPSGRAPDLREYLCHCAARMFRWRDLRGERDARDDPVAGERMTKVWNRVRDAVLALPALPLSPIDAITEGLEAAGLSVAEISGRDLRVSRVSGLPVPREKPDKRDQADRFNSGAADALIFTPAAGGTGASYHAGAGFADRRPRSILQVGMSFDIIDHIQAMGRGNRFDQVNLPKFITVFTETPPDHRMMQIINAKLREAGALLDGDRAHPALTEDIPDLSNPVGARALERVLKAAPEINGRLDRPRLAPGGAAAAEPYVRSVLTRSILLPDDERGRLMRMWTGEYEASLTELDSRGENPLRVPHLPGFVEIRSDSPHYTRDFADENIDSAFGRPPRLLEGVWHAPRGLTGAQIRAQAAAAQEKIDADPAASPEYWADRVRNAAAAAAARQDGERADAGLEAADAALRVRVLAEMLPQMRIGSVWRRSGALIDGEGGVIVGYSPPADPELAVYPHQHQFLYARAGAAEAELMRAEEIYNSGQRTAGNVLNPDGAALLGAFDALSERRQRPVQIVAGAAARMAAGNLAGRDCRRHTFTDSTGRTRTGIVSTDTERANFQKTRFSITAGLTLRAAQAAARGDYPPGSAPAAEQQTSASLNSASQKREWLVRIGWMRNQGLFAVTGAPVTQFHLDSFWGRHTGPALMRAMTAAAPGGTPPRSRPFTTVRLDTEDGTRRAERICALLDAHPDVQLLADPKMRGWRGGGGREILRREAPEWGKPPSDRTPEAAALAALAAGRNLTAPAPLMRIEWDGSGASATALPGDGGGIILEIPEYHSSTADFWRSEPARRLWRLMTGGELPKRPCAAAGRRSAFIAFPDSEEAARLLCDAAPRPRIEVNLRAAADMHPAPGAEAAGERPSLAA